MVAPGRAMGGPWGGQAPAAPGRGGAGQGPPRGGPRRRQSRPNCYGELEARQNNRNKNKKNICFFRKYKIKRTPRSGSIKGVRREHLGGRPTRQLERIAMEKRTRPEKREKNIFSEKKTRNIELLLVNGGSHPKRAARGAPTEANCELDFYALPFGGPSADYPRDASG